MHIYNSIESGSHSIMYELYADMSTEKIKRLNNHDFKIRRVIVSTNVSESSITLENIKFVIDCMFVKIKQYNYDK
jgi:HrpA-like RNA helicase